MTAAGAALLVTLLGSHNIHIIPWAALASSGGLSAGRAHGATTPLRCTLVVGHYTPGDQHPIRFPRELLTPNLVLFSQTRAHRITII